MSHATVPIRGNFATRERIKQPAKVFKYMANAVFTFRMFQMEHIQPAGAPPVMLPFSSRLAEPAVSPTTFVPQLTHHLQWRISKR